MEGESASGIVKNHVGVFKKESNDESYRVSLEGSVSCVSTA